MKIRKILAIDHDQESLRILKKLFFAKYEFIWAKNGVEGIRVAYSQMPDLILVELSVSKMDGFEVCSLLRGNSETKHIPVIATSAVNDFEAMLKVLNLGADDFIAKPFHVRDVFARVNARIRRIEEREEPSGLLACGNVELNCDTFECHVGGKPVSLSTLEFKMLRYFVENQNKVLSRKQILSAVWKRKATDRTIDVHLTTLRKKLVNSDVSFCSLYGAGYALKKNKAKSYEEDTSAASPALRLG